MLECEWQGVKYPVQQAKNGMFYIEIQSDEGPRRIDVQVTTGENWGTRILVYEITLPQLLKYYRARLGYTLDELSDVTGIHKQMIWAYEHDIQPPTKNNLKKLRDVLGPIPEKSWKEQN